MSVRTRKHAGLMGVLAVVAGIIATAWHESIPAQATPAALTNGSYTLEFVLIQLGGGHLTDASQNDRGFAVIGQDVVGVMTSPDYTFEVGTIAIIQPALFTSADFDTDGDVDGDDLDAFENCATGPETPYDPGSLPVECTLLPDRWDVIAPDFDRDQDVDQGDFGLFQIQFTGSLP